MAALVLSAAGAAVGGALFGPVGAIAGRLVGALGGNMLDRSLLGGGQSRTIEGPRLGDLDLMVSTEGSPIPRVYGRVRLAGEVIWATQLEEVIESRTEDAGGGKGGAPTVTNTTYTYFANIAVGLCEGEVSHVARVWADGKPLDLAGVTMRVHVGGEDQEPDPLIVAKEGEGAAPAYRGLAYVVFERLPLAPFGNRIPQLSFEVVRSVGRLERMIRAITLIPGSTEFGYEPATVVQTPAPGQSVPENRHVFHAPSDLIGSLEDLQATCPNLERVAVVVSWFGNDLRAGHCLVQPGVDNPDKVTHGAAWQVAGVVRDAAYVVSQIDARPAYGGTPSDESVVHLIEELHARGLAVTLYPFVMMDVPADNALPDPYTGDGWQPPYPWRGQITCDPAPGQPGTPDGSSAAADQVNAFFAGAGDWGFRRLILHYASLAAAAGGVDSFLIGSELAALTRVRSASGVYPAVDQLVALAAEVRAILGPDTKITYGADWTEYGAHVVDPSANEIRFPLDPLWASDDIDAIGIDYYAPLADWRDGAVHLDRALAGSIRDRDYLQGRIDGGEGFDWYYPDAEARLAQERTPITDGIGKPWIHRQKDLWHFWSEPHVERVGGAELASPTAWIPQSKPIWLTEFGCPAVDKGANQPSVFPDPKSSVGGLPYFSDGSRDDLMQRRYLEAVIAAFDPDWGGALNEAASPYDGMMLDPSRLYVWTWDARPYPVFPQALEVWSDGANWQTGHWLTGRLGGAPLDELVAAILADSSIHDMDTSQLGEGPMGYLIDRPMSPRAAIEPLAQAYAFDASEVGDTLFFRPRGGLPALELDEDDLVLPDSAAPVRLLRAQETELPREVSLAFSHATADYRRSVALSRRLVGGSSRTSHADLAVVTDHVAAERRADIWLQDLWAGRESADFAVTRQQLGLVPGDVVALTVAGRRRLWELREIVETQHRAIRARSIDPDVFEQPVALPQPMPTPLPPAQGPVHAVALDLPTLAASPSPALAHAAVAAKPWPVSVTIWRSIDGSSYQPHATAAAPAIIGETMDPLPRGPTSRWHHATFRVRLFGGHLSSVSDAALFAGANVAALRREGGAWEVLQFAQAELVEEGIYSLSRLLRGQAGSEHAMADPLPPGAPFVLLDRHVLPVAKGNDDLERPMLLRFVGAGFSHADPSAVSLSVTPRATAVRPLSPVHGRARRRVDGVHLSWIRRARFDADGWGAEIPLGETGEAYAVDILDGDTVVRSFECATPSLIYGNADELTDFGFAQTSLKARVSQLSSTVGRGFASEFHFTL